MQELQPDIKQATEDVLQANRDFKELGEGAAELWSDVRRAVSGAGERDAAGDAFREGAGLEWEDIRKDAAKAATGVFGEVSALRVCVWLERGLCHPARKKLSADCVVFAMQSIASAAFMG